MPVFKIEYEAMDKIYRVIIKAKNESAAISKLEKVLYSEGMESEAHIYSIEEIE